MRQDETRKENRRLGGASGREGQIDALLSALSEASAFLCEGDDAAGALVRVRYAWDALRGLLPGLGIYAWVRDDCPRTVRQFPSSCEAEAALAEDVAGTLSRLGMDSRDVRSGRYDVFLYSDGGERTWQRLYAPGPEDAPGRTGYAIEYIASSKPECVREPECLSEGKRSCEASRH